MRNLLLARRLIESVIDPDASRAALEEAGAEVAEIAARLKTDVSQLFTSTHFEDIRTGDLSPEAWLFLLDAQTEDSTPVPASILDQLYLDISDAAFRFRLVRGSLSRPSVRRAYEQAAEDTEPRQVDDLPASWPKQRLQTLEKIAKTEEVPLEAAQGLQEFMLYLLQDGSPAALLLAASAIAPEETWRTAARDVVKNLVRSVDPDLGGYGRAFRNARI